MQTGPDDVTFSDENQRHEAKDDLSNVQMTKKMKNVFNDEILRIEEFKLNYTVVSVATMESIFNRKNGTPRQSGICPQSKGIVRLHRRLFNNPMHALQGIEQFDYVWIVYYFHENTSKRRFNTKVHPPRLNGASCGVFSSRAPHRPNAFGLTLAKIDAVKDGCLYVSGIDILDGTPIVDIKPYIDKYDSPLTLTDSYQMDSEQKQITQSQSSNQEQTLIVSEESNTVPQGWVDGSVVSDIEVDFTVRSLRQLSQFHPSSHHEPISQQVICDYCFRMFANNQQAKLAIVNLLRADPRSVYRRTKCIDRLYYFTIDSIHITAWFDVQTNLVEVVKIKPYTGKIGGNK